MKAKKRLHAVKFSAIFSKEKLKLASLQSGICGS